MKRITITRFILAHVSAVALVAASSAWADTLAQWTFENSGPSIAGTSTTFGPIAPEVGSGNAYGVHASASTVWSSPVGNGSPESFSANNWSVNDYFEFTIPSTVGYKDVSISYDQIGSGTGPRDFSFTYSTDGSIFITVGSYQLTSGVSWSGTIGGRPDQLSFLNISALDNWNGTIYFRVVDDSTTSINGGTVAAGGTGRIDNFTVTATMIPEPSALALVGLGVAGLVAFRRRNG